MALFNRKPGYAGPALKKKDEDEVFRAAAEVIKQTEAYHAKRPYSIVLLARAARVLAHLARPDVDTAGTAVMKKVGGSDEEFRAAVQKFIDAVCEGKTV